MFRKGDEVLVNAIVEWDEEGGQVFINIGGAKPFVPRKFLTMVRPVLNAGETIYADGFECTVIAVHDDMVWASYIEDGETNTQVFSIESVERKDKSEEDEIDHLGTVALDAPANT